MNLKSSLANVLYFAVGAAAVGLEALSDAAETLTAKGADIVNHGKEVFRDFCSKYEIPDDEDPAVVILEDLGDLSEI